MGRTLAYIAGEFPSRSETFVYREVRELRRRGWTVHAVSLHAPRETAIAGLSDLYQDLTVVYDPGGLGMVGRSLAEAAAHPVRALQTFAAAVGDALAPDEPLTPSSRLKLPMQAFAALGLAKRLRSIGVDHIHCHFAHAPTTLGMYAARQMRVPFSFTGHANDIFQRRSILKTKLARASFVSCISAWHRSFYQEVQGAPGAGAADAYRVIRCGVDVSAWTESVRHANGSASTMQILTLCRLVEKKGVDTLIRALALLRGIATGGTGAAGSVDWRLTIAGDGPYRQSLEALARELKCDAAITWLGAVDNEKVPGLLAKTDVFALPCKEDSRGDRDGIPVVLMEAMACGVPALSGNLPAIRELIDDGVNGLLVDGTDPKALADRLAWLAANPAERSRIGHAGRLRVEQEFSLSLNVDRLESALRTPSPDMI
ncbi:MAG: glycosyltransferase family 4 protein [Planctomycetota bacterium]|nr:glycosyltransferase family 4 protein [Planctomycetota bacterium]